MKALNYLFFTTIKNSLKELLKNKGKLFGMLFFIVMMLFVILGSFNSQVELKNLRDPKELYAIIFVFYAAMFLIGSMKGLSSGASFYSMADVNLLFSCPISSKRILLYGLIKQLGMSLLLGFFLLFQYAWLHDTYNISLLDLVGVLIGYGIMLFSAQLVAMVIYSFTSSNEQKKKIVKFCLFGIYFVIVLYAIYPILFNSTNMIESVASSLSAQWLNYVPIIGWIKAAIVGMITGSTMPIIFGLGATFLLLIIVLYVFTKSRTDYYEDVLKATEVSFSAITAKKEGKINEVIPTHVKVGKTGIRKGKGSGVFYYKHMIENRRSRVFILDTMSLILAATIIVFAFIMRKAGIIAVFGFATYMQIFSSATGRWIRELMLPYIYLVPESSFHKLVMVCRENIYKIVLEACIIFIPVGFVMQASVSETIICILARIGFGILFMAGNILSQRILGTITNAVYIFMLYIIIMIILALPGFALGFLFTVMFSTSTGIVLPLLGTFIWNICISALIVYLCREILNYAELNNR